MIKGIKTPAIGVFSTKNEITKGTFLTTTGDYRFLEGTATDTHLKLVTFDGNHAFAFEMELNKDNPNQLSGVFKSGKSWNESMEGVKNSEATLPDANTLTHLKEGYDKIEFSFPNLQGKPISLNDEKYQNKVVIVQILGSWCPNCMDETQFLTDWYAKNKEKDVEIIGLGYETKDDFEYAKKRLTVMKQRFGIEYELLVAGTSDKKEASKTLPMLSDILSFPTMIIIDKQGKVQNIHTGFSGPATGEYYVQFVEEFQKKINEIL